MKHIKLTSLIEGKFPKVYKSKNDGIWKKEWERGDKAKYVGYYLDNDGNEHRIEDGIFGSEQELKDFADDHTLSNQLYNKINKARTSGRF
jgi:hypothetical protein